MINNSNIYLLLNNLESQESYNTLIELCQKIAVSYLHSVYKKVYKLFESECITLDEFAIEAIAPLFVQDKENQKLSLLKSFYTWSPAIKNEEDAFYFLNKVVSHRVEQHIFTLLREEDPIFSKVLDSVNYLIKTQGYQKIHALGKTYIVESGFYEDGIGYIDHLEFESLDISFFREKKDIIKKIIDYLKNETKFVPAVPLNELIYRIKHISIAGFVTIESTEESRKQFELNELLQYALGKANEKLIKSYFDKGKLSEPEVIALSKTLEDLCEDLKDGGIKPGLYYYLLTHMNNLTKEDYQLNYNNILEYLFKITKSILRENLKEKN